MANANETLNVKLDSVTIKMTPKEAESMMDTMMEFCPMKKIEPFINSCRQQFREQLQAAAIEQGLINNESKN